MAWWFPDSDHILLDRRLRYGNTDLRELAHYVWRAPGWVHFGHCTDELPDFLGRRRTTWRALATELRPVLFESLALPSNYGIRLHENQRIFPVRPRPRQQTPQNSISRPNLWPSYASLKNTELMAKGQILGLKTSSRLEERREAAKNKQYVIDH